MRLVDLVIPNAGTLSNSVPLTFTRPNWAGPTDDEVIGLDEASIYAPGTLTGVISIEVSADDEVTWHDTGVDIAVDAIVLLSQVNGTHIRLSSTLAEGAPRTFFLHGAGPERA